MEDSFENVYTKSVARRMLNVSGEERLSYEVQVQYEESRDLKAGRVISQKSLDATRVSPTLFARAFLSNLYASFLFASGECNLQVARFDYHDIWWDLWRLRTR